MSARRSKGASRDKKKSKEIGEYTANIGRTQRNQEHFEHQISVIPKIRDDKDEIITSKNNRTKKIALTMKRR